MKVEKYVFNNWDEWKKFTTKLYGCKCDDFLLTDNNLEWLETFKNRYDSLVNYVSLADMKTRVYVAAGVNYTLYALANSFWIEPAQDEHTGCYLITDTREAEDIGNFIKENFNPEQHKATVKDLINYLEENFSLSAYIKYEGDCLPKEKIDFFIEATEDNDLNLMF